MASLSAPSSLASLPDLYTPADIDPTGTTAVAQTHPMLTQADLYREVTDLAPTSASTPHALGPDAPLTLTASEVQMLIEEVMAEESKYMSYLVPDAAPDDPLRSPAAKLIALGTLAEEAQTRLDQLQGLDLQAIMATGVDYPTASTLTERLGRERYRLEANLVQIDLLQKSLDPDAYAENRTDLQPNEFTEVEADCITQLVSYMRHTKQKLEQFVPLGPDHALMEGLAYDPRVNGLIKQTEDALAQLARLQEILKQPSISCAHFTWMVRDEIKNLVEYRAGRYAYGQAPTDGEHGSTPIGKGLGRWRMLRQRQSKSGPIKPVHADAVKERIEVLSQ